MTEQFKPENVVDAEERLHELHPELTNRLARALDRLQMAQPYQQLRGRTAQAKPAAAAPADLTAEQHAIHEAAMTQQLSALLTVAAELNKTVNSPDPKASPDRHFRDNLKEQLRRVALDKKPSIETPDKPS